MNQSWEEVLRSAQTLFGIGSGKIRVFESTSNAEIASIEVL